MVMTRRKLITGMLATPLIAAGSGSAEFLDSGPSHSTDIQSGSPAEGTKDKYTLNVVLHGMCVIAVPHKATATSSDGIEILIPGQMGHKRMWGMWCSESDLVASGTPYEIVGLTRFPAIDIEDLQPDDNAVLKGISLKRSGSALLGLSCSIKLPFPLKVYSMRKACRKPHLDDFLTGDGAYYLHRAPSKISMVHIFQYTFSDPEKVFYGGQKLTLQQGQTTKNLHIWSDPVDGRHELDDARKMVPLDVAKIHPGRPNAVEWYWIRQASPFELMVKAFTGFDCKQSEVYHHRSGLLDPAEVIAGFNHYEKYTLSERGYPNCLKLQPKLTHPCDYEERHGEAKIVHCMALFVYGGPSLQP